MTHKVTKEMIEGYSQENNQDRIKADVTIVGSKKEIDVSVADIDMPFMSMVNFMVKAALASIPALLILLVFFAVASIVFTAILGHRGY